MMERTNSRLIEAVAALLLVSVASGVRAQDNNTTTTVTTAPNGDATTITVTVNNKPVVFSDQGRPRMFGGRVMVPLRGVVEQLGGNVLYDASSQVITGAHPGTSDQFRLRVGSTQALVDGKTVSLDTPPRVVAGTTYVPLRFVSEALGAQVSWDNPNHTVVITAAGNQATVSTGS